MKRKGFFALAGGLFAAMLSLTVPAAAADAYPPAYNYKTQYLAAYPVDSLPTSCVQRRIELLAGNYQWTQYFNNFMAIERPNMYLGAGWYTWTDCLDPKTDEYFHTTALDPDNPNWETAYISGPWALDEPRTVTWGSSLVPLFSSSKVAEKAPDGLTDSAPQVERRDR
jgi:hypothetical protein